MSWRDAVMHVGREALWEFEERCRIAEMVAHSDDNSVDRSRGLRVEEGTKVYAIGFDGKKAFVGRLCDGPEIAADGVDK